MKRLFDKKSDSSVSLAEATRAKAFSIAGVLFLSCFCALYLYWGGNLAVTVHDQLDGEVLSYVLRSKDITSVFKHTFDTFMSGKADVEVPAPGMLLFYYLFPASTAYVIGLYFVRITAFIGLFDFLLKVKVQAIIAFSVSILYALLPVYSVYGLGIMGVPLVAAAFIDLRENKQVIGSYIILFLYVLNSSLSLVGYAVITLLSVVLYIWQRLSKTGCFKLQLIGFCEIVICYFICNIGLIKTITGKDNFISHRTEFVFVQKNSFFDTFWEMFIHGQYHAASCQERLICVILIALFAVSLSLISKRTTINLKHILLYSCVLLLLLIALFYAFYNSSVGFRLREIVFGNSALRSFQFDRFYWLNPFLWYTGFALALSCIYDMISNNKCKIVLLLIILALIGFQGAGILRKSEIKDNIKLNIYGQTKGVVTWNQFYCDDIFNNITEYLGSEKERAGVVSVGLFPSIPLFYGYKCIDGYSNNYDLNYKTQFGSVIKDELAKDGTISHYFYGWGNRCYVFSSELGQNFFIRKDSVGSISLLINTNELKKMGVSYILSAVQIRNTPDLNVTFLKMFDSDDSLYRIYLYHIN